MLTLHGCSEDYQENAGEHGRPVSQGRQPSLHQGLGAPAKFSVTIKRVLSHRESASFLSFLSGGGCVHRGFL